MLVSALMSFVLLIIPLHFFVQTFIPYALALSTICWKGPEVRCCSRSVRSMSSASRRLRMGFQQMEMDECMQFTLRWPASTSRCLFKGGQQTRKHRGPYRYIRLETKEVYMTGNKRSTYDWKQKKYIWLETKEVHMTGNKTNAYDWKQNKYIWLETKEVHMTGNKEVHMTGNKEVHKTGNKRNT